MSFNTKLLHQLLGLRGFILRKFHKHNFSKRTHLYVLNANSFTYLQIPFTCHYNPLFLYFLSHFWGLKTFFFFFKLLTLPMVFLFDWDLQIHLVESFFVTTLSSFNETLACKVFFSRTSASKVLGPVLYTLYSPSLKSLYRRSPHFVIFGTKRVSQNSGITNFETLFSSKSQIGSKDFLKSTFLAIFFFF